MTHPFRIDNLWQNMSTELLDAAMRVKPLRLRALGQGEKQLLQKYVVENEDGYPAKVQQMRCRALTNLLHSIDRALDDGRISPQVRRSIVKEFVGNLIVGAQQRTQRFSERYGRRPPTFLTISPTKRCNLRCTGCYAASSADNANTLTYPVFDRILKDKRDEWGSHFTVLSGGEPTMYRSEGKDLFDILREHQNQYFMMYTNGTLIDDRLAKKMAEVGNITPAISVEGWEEQTDERRGKGAFAKIHRAMEALKRNGVPFGISVTATRHNAEIILSDEFIRHFFEKVGAIYGWIFQYMPIGRSYTIDLMVTPEQRRWMLEKELQMINDENLFYIDFWNGRIMSVGCISAGRDGGYFYIDWDGNVSPCVFFPYKHANMYELYAGGGTLSSLLKDDYLRDIRSWQKQWLGDGNRPMNNLFTPCPIRDHYEFAWQTIRKNRAEPLDDPATRALSDPDYRRRMVEYDLQIAELLDPLWQREVYPSRENR
jgi:MoaA/NifB/PqqE/SkfB family radical SAM enzyme